MHREANTLLLSYTHRVNATELRCRFYIFLKILMFSGARNGTQVTVHIMQTLLPLSYTPSLNKTVLKTERIRYGKWCSETLMQDRPRERQRGGSSSKRGGFQKKERDQIGPGTRRVERE